MSGPDYNSGSNSNWSLNAGPANFGNHSAPRAANPYFVHAPPAQHAPRHGFTPLSAAAPPFVFYGAAMNLNTAQVQPLGTPAPSQGLGVGNSFHA